MQLTRVARLHQRVSASKASGQTPPRVPCPRPSLLSYVTLCSALCSNARVAPTFTTTQGRASAGVSSCLLANRCLPALPQKTQCEGSKTRSPCGHRCFVNTRLARHVSRVPSCSTFRNLLSHSACLPFLHRKRAATVNSRTSMAPPPQTGAGLSSRVTRHVPCYLPMNRCSDERESGAEREERGMQRYRAVFLEKRTLDHSAGLILCV